MKKKRNSGKEDLRLLDIAIDILSLFQTPDGDWSKQQIEKVYEFFKINRYAFSSSYHTLTSGIKKEEIMRPFEICFGKPSDIFWIKMVEEGFPYTRTCRLEKILKRKRILTLKEYEYVSVVALSFWSHELISTDEMLNLYIYREDFARKYPEKVSGLKTY